MTTTAHTDVSIDSPTKVAAILYMTERSNFTFDTVSVRSGIDIELLRSIYTLRSDLLRGYFNDAWQRFSDMESTVPEFASYSLAEKLTTLVFSLCDEFDLVDGFAAETYGALIHREGLDSTLEKHVRVKMAVYVATDENISLLVRQLPGHVAISLLTWTVLRLINVRVSDRSIEKERTSALTDKTTTFLQSVLYTGTLDHFIDLARYLGMTYYPNN